MIHQVKYRNITVGFCLNFFFMLPLKWHKSVPLPFLPHCVVPLQQLMVQMYIQGLNRATNFIYFSLTHTLQSNFHQLVLSSWVVYSLIRKYIKLGTSNLFQKAHAFISPLGSHLSLLDINVIQIHRKFIITKMLHNEFQTLLWQLVYILVSKCSLV